MRQVADPVVGRGHLALKSLVFRPQPEQVGGDSRSIGLRGWMKIVDLPGVGGGQGLGRSKLQQHPMACKKHTGTRQENEGDDDR